MALIYLFYYYRIFLKCEPSVERLKICPDPYLEEEFIKDAVESDSDDEAKATFKS